MAATSPVSRDVLNREANARFWAQTGFKPGQKLDPSNPTDKAMMPVWMDIFRKVKAEADHGTLVTTYDHPAVAQGVSDAAVADKVTAMHTEAASRSTDPATVQANTAAALTAARVAAQRLRDAVARQPPTASPAVVQDAADAAARTPPPPDAPAADQIAHAQAQAAPQTVTPDRQLIDATNNEFWRRTHYKPGQKLDMSIAEDRKKAKIWMQIYHELQQGGLPLAGPEPLSQPMTPPSGPPIPYGPPHVPPSMGPPPGPSQMQFPTPFPPGPRPTWPGPRPPMGPPSRGARPPIRPPMGPPSMGPRPPMGPPMGPAQPEAPGAPGVPPPDATYGAPEASADVPPDVSAPVPKKPSVLKFVAIGAAVIAGGGLLYYVGTRKPSRGQSSRSTPSRSTTSRSTTSRSPSFAPTSSFGTPSARVTRS